MEIRLYRRDQSEMFEESWYNWTRFNVLIEVLLLRGMQFCSFSKSFHVEFYIEGIIIIIIIILIRVWSKKGSCMHDYRQK